MNKVILLGRICNDLELRYLKNESGVLNINLAVPRSFKNLNGEYETDFIKVTLYGKTAEIVNKNCKKGDRIVIDGRLQYRTYQDKDGNARSDTSVVSEKVTLIELRKKEEKESPIEEDPFKEFGKNLEIEDSELPF